jgi:hypothetical protein
LDQDQRPGTRHGRREHERSRPGGVYTGPSVAFLFTPLGWLCVALIGLYVAARLAWLARLGDLYGFGPGLYGFGPERSFLDPGFLRDHADEIPAALAVASPLLITAVVLGRGKAGWRQIRAMTAGSILLGICAAVAALLGALVVWVFDPKSTLPSELHFTDVDLLASMASIGGPILLAIGLSRAMARPVPQPAWWATAAILVLAAYESGDRLWTLWDQLSLMRDEGLLYSPSALAWLQAALAGGFLLAGALLAWVCFSAYRRREAPRGFWGLLLLGSGLSLAADLWVVARLALWRMGQYPYEIAGVSIEQIVDAAVIAATVTLAVSLFRWEPGYPEAEGVEKQAAAGPAARPAPART